MLACGSTAVNTLRRSLTCHHRHTTMDVVSRSRLYLTAQPPSHVLQLPNSAGSYKPSADDHSTALRAAVTNGIPFLSGICTGFRVGQLPRQTYIAAARTVGQRQLGAQQSVLGGLRLAEGIRAPHGCAYSSRSGAFSGARVAPAVGIARAQVPGAEEAGATVGEEAELANGGADAGEGGRRRNIQGKPRGGAGAGSWQEGEAEQWVRAVQARGDSSGEGPVGGDRVAGTRKPRKGEELELMCDSLAFKGLGVCRVPESGFVVLCERALPGERLVARIIKAKRQYAEAYKVRVLSPHDHATTPRCQHFGHCGGCRLQNLEYEAQLRIKQQQQVAELMVRVGKFTLTPSSDASTAAPTPSPAAAEGEAEPPQEQQQQQQQQADSPVELREIIGCTEPYHYRNKARCASLPITLYPTPLYPTPLYATPLYPTPLYPTPLYPTPLYPTPLFPTPLFPTPRAHSSLSHSSHPLLALSLSPSILFLSIRFPQILSSSPLLSHLHYSLSRFALVLPPSLTLSHFLTLRLFPCSLRAALTPQMEFSFSSRVWLPATSHCIIPVTFLPSYALSPHPLHPSDKVLFQLPCVALPSRILPCPPSHLSPFPYSLPKPLTPQMEFSFNSRVWLPPSEMPEKPPRLHMGGAATPGAEAAVTVSAVPAPAPAPAPEAGAAAAAAAVAQAVAAEAATGESGSESEGEGGGELREEGQEGRQKQKKKGRGGRGQNVTPNPGGFALGLHAPRRFDKVLPIEECHLQHPTANEVREEEFMVVLVTKTDCPDLLQPLADHLSHAFPRLVSFIMTVNPSLADVTPPNALERLLLGRRVISDSLRSLHFDISAASFFQTNSDQAEVLYELVEQACALKGDGSELLLDLFCGTGTIGLSLASR
ncbi:unnamed protein product [Closterium sp. NIES-54]